MILKKVGTKSKELTTREQRGEKNKMMLRQGNRKPMVRTATVCCLGQQPERRGFTDAAT